MKKLITLILMGFILSGCFIRPHKLDIDQGNIINQENVGQLRIGMSEAEVRAIMGNPVLVNIFATNRLDYIYSFKPSYGEMRVTRVICIFQNGRLKEIQRG